MVQVYDKFFNSILLEWKIKLFANHETVPTVYVHLFRDDADDTHTHAQRVGEKREFTRKTYRLAGDRNATGL